jgi:HD-GYP domain-containing protein (c-di-GMP phosphodiesterase class II)
VLAACDAWWAMTSRRPYAVPLAPEEATAELAAGAGHQLDPEVAGALLAEVAGVTLVA